MMARGTWMVMGGLEACGRVELRVKPLGEKGAGE